MKLHRKHPLNDLTKIPSNIFKSMQNSVFYGNTKKRKLKVKKCDWAIVSYMAKVKTLINLLQAILIGLKNIATRGRGCFALYGYFENFSNLILQKYLANFQFNLMEWSLDDRL